MGPVSRGVDIVNTMGGINSRVGGESTINISRVLTHIYGIKFIFTYAYTENSGHANESIGETRI